MNLPAQIRAIYAELRSVLDETYSDREVLRLAHSVVVAHSAAGQVDNDYFGVARDQRTILALPLDEAMKDGGWRVLDFEKRRGIALEDGLATEFEDDFAAETKSLVSRLNQIRRSS